MPLARQFQDYIYFERAEGREIITAAEFDFARGEDRSVASRESMERFVQLYVAAVRERGLDEEAVTEIAQYFVDLSKRIRAQEQARVQAEPIHLQALLEFAGKAWQRPLAADEIRGLSKFYRTLREEDQLGHEEAIRDVLTSILASPFFCGSLGGTVQTGRVLDYLNLGDENRRLCSLYLSIMDRMGVQLNSFGDATNRLADF